MEHVGSVKGCQQIRSYVSEGAVPTRREVRDLVWRASTTASQRGQSGIVYVAGVLRHLTDADALNNNNLNLPPALRRILRKQGRINRTILSATEELLGAVRDFPGKRDAGMLADIHQHLLNARGLNSQARGNAYMRRLNRPQKDLNDALNSALTLLMNYVLDPARGLFAATDKTNATAEHLRWHVREAGYRNYLNIERSLWVRRILCDQYLVNRCHIVSLRLMCELLTQ